jgi:hypothetical protein
MTAGGRRAKSWEFHDMGCNARLLGRLMRTPARAESHAQAEEAARLARARAKFPKRGSQESTCRVVAALGVSKPMPGLGELTFAFRSHFPRW